MEGSIPPILGKEVIAMSIFEAIYLGMTFGLLLLALLSYIKK